MSGRNPFSFPPFQNDNNFKGKIEPTKKPWKAISDVPHAHGQAPWNRIYNNPTLASTRNQHHHFDQQAPLDKLDFAIKSLYDQHIDAFQNNNEVLFQRETCTDTHGRKLKNRTKEIPPAFDPMYPPLQINASKKKADPNNVKGGMIQGHHSAATNGGYVRRHDGGFYYM